MSGTLGTDWRAIHGDVLQGARVLVTGGAGFIGSHLAVALGELGASVSILDDLSNGEMGNLAGAEDYRFIKASITDFEALERAADGCEVIFHEAAKGSVPESLRDPRRYQDVNATGTLNVLEAARKARVRRVVFAASSSAYGETEQLPKVETIPPDPRSPYAATKAAGESLMAAYAHSFGVDTLSLRYFNVFGPRQNANSAYAAAIAAFATAVLNDQPPVIFGDGSQSRDFTYVDNVVHANLLAARSAGPLKGAIVNVGTGKRITINQLARRVVQIYGKRHEPRYAPARAGDVMHSVADLSRARALLGYEVIVDFEQGLEATLRWYEQAKG